MHCVDVDVVPRKQRDVATSAASQPHMRSPGAEQESLPRPHESTCGTRRHAEASGETWRSLQCAQSASRAPNEAHAARRTSASDGGPRDRASPSRVRVWGRAGCLSSGSKPGASVSSTEAAPPATAAASPATPPAHRRGWHEGVAPIWVPGPCCPLWRGPRRQPMN